MAYADAIASIESGGNYGAQGPVTKSGDRAYGKYQVMGANIPQWTTEVLGAPMTPQEFLSNPQAQDAVFNGIFNKYVAKYGPEGAAQAWFGGPGAVGKTERKDMLGTSVGDYGQRFMAALGGAPPNVGASPQVPTLPQAPPQVAQSFAPAIPVQAAQNSAPIDYGPMLQQLQPLAAPPPIRRFNLAQALQNIPTPAGFRGFSFRG